MAANLSSEELRRLTSDPRVLAQLRAGTVRRDAGFIALTESDKSGRAGSKYGNERAAYNGQGFDSKAEAVRCEELDRLAAGGAIAGYARQVKFRLGLPENVYVCDFVVFEPDGRAWAEDVKGHETAKFKRDRKLWARYGPVALQVRRRRKGAWEIETIQPQARGER